MYVLPYIGGIKPGLFEDRRRRGGCALCAVCVECHVCLIVLLLEKGTDGVHYFLFNYWRHCSYEKKNELISG